MASAAIRKAIAGQDKRDIRAALRISLTFDHNYVTGMFQDDVKYCENQGISLESLYEKWDGRDLLEGRDSEDSFETLLGHLSTNFARERLERLLKLGKKLWPQEQVRSSGAQSRTEKPKPAEPQSTGTGSKERIFNERVTRENTSTSRNSSSSVNTRIKSERELPPEGGPRSTHHSSTHHSGTGQRQPAGGDTNFTMTAVAVVVAVAVVAATIIILA